MSPLLSRTGLDARSQGPKLAHAAHYCARQLAALFETDARHLRRLWIKAFGCTPKKWLMELRADQCRHFVRMRKSAEEIARNLFYTDAAHFCHDFKRHHGQNSFHWLEAEILREHRETRVMRSVKHNHLTPAAGSAHCLNGRAGK